MTEKPNILVCPLDWGIGHATRCIPIIHELIRQKTNVIIGADNQPLALLKQEFPHLQFIRFPGYKFSYPGNEKMALKMAVQSPSILYGIRSENRLLKDIVQKYQINAVISDNRYGLYHHRIPCVFMTHQLNIQVPGSLKYLQPLLLNINKNFISKFDECWIPDWENGYTLSGELSHAASKISNVYFIGPLSRFSQPDFDSIDRGNFTYDFIAIVSGPEPQRTLFEKSLFEQVQSLNKKGIVVLGKPEGSKTIRKIGESVTVFSHLPASELEQILLKSKTVVSRPGYSTIMDLVALGKKAVFIPTPGQTEQEYLADYFFRNGKFYRMFQHEFDLAEALEKADHFGGMYEKYDQTALKERIKHLLSKL